jgi:2-oxoglutarate dehydrogenase complex dehydrogenase (E1) component-like enzyme
MGAWQYMAMNLRQVNLEGVMRKASAAAAEGSKDLHQKRLARLFEDLFQYAKVKVK